MKVQKTCRIDPATGVTWWGIKGERLVVEMLPHLNNNSTDHDSLGVHVLEPEVVRLEEVQLLAHLVEQHPTHGLRLKVKHASLYALTCLSELVLYSKPSPPPGLPFINRKKSRQRNLVSGFDPRYSAANRRISECIRPFGFSWPSRGQHWRKE